MHTYCYSHLEDFVKSFYSRLHIYQPTDLNMFQIAKELRIKVFFWPNGSQALFFEQTGYIFLNNELSPQQQWQDFTHELCHVLLHSGDQMHLHPLFVEYQEHKAKNFAMHAAIPTFMLDELYRIHKYRLSVWMIQEMFNVEENFAKKRLIQYAEKLKCIS
ncbi:ImmA/IrrE family metallo-endopeptidase [Viridibacillus sp. FSL E2-0187]|uniref:ImmA/IrrE family metallo-endopeptidase n=1 Tax=Viridibacillus sp. FSL E2-0187 TaxID=2921362 RepID=UPI0030F63065